MATAAFAEEVKDKTQEELVEGTTALMDNIGDLVKAALGPLPTVCQEQVLLDMERARMGKEDKEAALIHTDKKRRCLERHKNSALVYLQEAQQHLVSVRNLRTTELHTIQLHTTELHGIAVRVGLARMELVTADMVSEPSETELAEEETDVEPS